MPDVIWCMTLAYMVSLTHHALGSLHHSSVSLCLVVSRTNCCRRVCRFSITFYFYSICMYYRILSGCQLVPTPSNSCTGGFAATLALSGMCHYHKIQSRHAVSFCMCKKYVQSVPGYDMLWVLWMFDFLYWKKSIYFELVTGHRPSVLSISLIFSGLHM